MRISLLIGILFFAFQISIASDIDTVLKTEANILLDEHLKSNDSADYSISVHLNNFKETHNSIYLIESIHGIWHSYYIEYGYTPAKFGKLLFLNIRKSKTKPYFTINKVQTLKNIKDVCREIEGYGVSRCNNVCDSNTCYEVGCSRYAENREIAKGLNCEERLNNLILLLESEFFIGDYIESTL